MHAPNLKGHATAGVGALIDRLVRLGVNLSYALIHTTAPSQLFSTSYNAGTRYNEHIDPVVRA